MSVATYRASPNAPLHVVKGDAQPSLVVNAQMVRCLLPEFDQVSITVVDGAGAMSTCARAGDLVADLDRLQYDLDEGPCLDSLRAGVPVVAPDLQRGDRWKHYVSCAADLGLRSQLATPLSGHEGKPMGVLNMYSTTRDDITPTAPLIAQALAAQVATALANLRQIDNLQRALATRALIGQAIGLLMARYQISEASALALLRRRSSYANVKLREIAARMVAEHDATGRELPSAAIC